MKKLVLENFGRAFLILKGVLRHPREVEKFLGFCYPSNSAQRNLSFGTMAANAKIRKVLVDLGGEADLHEGPIVEIGALFGHSAQAICAGKNPSKQLVCVDSFLWNPYGLSRERHRELLERNLDFFKDLHSVKVEAVESNAAFFASWGDVKPSLVVIDAGHFYEEVLQDINWAHRLKVPIICGDDFHFAGVERAVREVFGEEIEIVDDRFWIWRDPVCLRTDAAS